MIIKDLSSLKEFCKNIETPVFGVGVYAFDRLGLENILPQYRLLALRYSLDTILIEKDIEIFALEKGMNNKHLQEPRNSTTIITHPQTKKYLEKFKNPALIPYKSSSKMEEYCQKNNWTLVASPVEFGKELFENKIKFRRILKEINIPTPPGTIKEIDKLEYGQLINSYGLPFVIQHPTRGGGKGTFFIKNKKDFEAALDKLKFVKNEDKNIIEKDLNKEVIVAKFIEGPSPSICGCVTRQGILSTSPQYQVLDIPELFNPKKGSGLFCGHDWTASHHFSDKILGQAYDYVEKVGQYFKSKGYKGIFGLDFILDKESQKLYIVEANPRLIGQLPTLSMVQVLNNEPPIMAFHLLEYLGLDYQVDLEALNNLMRQKKYGTHVFLHNLTEKWTRNYGVLKPGVYHLESDKLKYLREGYKLQHLKNQDEFLITEGLAYKKSPFSPNRRLCRILTLQKILADYNQLTPWAYQIIKKTYQAFNLKPVRLVKLRKILNPNFLAKG